VLVEDVLVAAKDASQSAPRRGRVPMGKGAWVEIPTAEELGWNADSAGGYGFAFLPAMGRLIMAHPVIGPAFVQLLSTVMFGAGALSRQERELVATASAAAQDCFY
jgi:hypothetical protein